MKPFLPTLIFFFLIYFVSAQEKDNQGISPQEDSLQYLRDIEHFAPHPAGLKAPVLYNLAQICYEHDDFINTLKYLNFALTWDSLSAPSFHLKAEALYEMKKYEEAIRQFQAAIRLNPGNDQSFEGLGHCYFALKKYNLALQSFMAAAKSCRPGFQNPEPYRMMGIIYMEQNDVDKALGAWYSAESKGVMGTEAYSEALYSIWLLETRNGNDPKADSALRKLIQLTLPDPDCPLADCYDYFACAQIVKIYTMQKEYDKAKPYLDRLGKRPGSAVE